MNAPNPFLQVGLPATFAPTALGWTFTKIIAAGPDGPDTLHVLLVDTVIGRLGFTFDRDAFLRLSDQIREQVSGLTVASDIPPNGQRKYPGFGGR